MNTNLSERYAYNNANGLIDARRGTLNGGGEPDNATLIYIHNPDWQIIEVRDDEADGDVAIQRFIHASGNQSVTASAYVDDHVAYDRWDGEGWDRFYYLIDKQFNTVALFGGEITEHVLTDPYGRARTYDSSWANGADRSRIGNPFMHQGLHFDLEAGGVGYHNRTRQYNPRIGRFLQRDMIGYLDGVGLYLYLASQPNRFLDPNGTDILDSIWQWIVGGGGRQFAVAGAGVGTAVAEGGGLAGLGALATAAAPWLIGAAIVVVAVVAVWAIVTHFSPELYHACIAGCAGGHAAMIAFCHILYDVSPELYWGCRAAAGELLAGGSVNCTNFCLNLGP